MTIADVRITLWAIGLMVGAGIYSTIGNIVNDAGVWAPFMFVLASVVMLLNGAVLAITVRRFPHAGSILAVVRATMSPQMAVVFEVLRLVEGGLALCVTNKLIVRFWFGLMQGTGGNPPIYMEVVSLLAAVFIIYRGFDSAIDCGNVFTFVEVGGLLLVIATGGVTGLSSATSLQISTMPPPISTAAMTVSVKKIIFAFGGVQGVLDMAGDVPNSGQVLPSVVICSIAVTGLLYTLVCIAALSMVGVEGLTSQSAVSPLGMALEKVGFPLGTEASLTVISLMSIGNTSLGIFVFVSRIAMSLANHTLGGSVQPLTIYGLMVVCSIVAGQVLDVFELVDRVGVMLLVTFAVLNYAFVTSIAHGLSEKMLGVLALLMSLGFVVIDFIA